MFTRSYLVWVAAAALLIACSGEIGGISLDDSGTGDLVATISVNNGWHSIDASEPAFETLEFEVMARPMSRRMSAGITLGGPEVTELGDGPIKVRFAKDGFVDAYNDGVWDKQATVEYRLKAWYRIVIHADLIARTYDVEVEQYKGPPRTRLVTVIKGAPFDLEATGVESLTNWAAWSSGGELELTEASWVASGSCAPSTCESWGVSCGEPGDGCGGTLSCGSCATGQACDAGVCVDSCAPSTCESLGAECGLQGDGCGSTLSCGSCGVGQMCSSGNCVASSPPPPGASWWELVGEPDATNTGPNPTVCTAPSGCPNATLTNIGSCPDINVDGTVMENFQCSGSMKIDANNAVVRNFLINASGNYGIETQVGATGNLIEFGEIDGGDVTSDCFRGRGFTGRYLNVHNCSDTQKLGTPKNDPAGQGPLLIEHSYYHNATGGHGDTFQVYQDSHSPVTVRNSSLECGGTSCLITTSTVGGVITFEENWIYGKDTGDGSGFFFYCGWDSGDVGRPAIFLTRNLIDRNYRFGLAKDEQDCVWTDNLAMDTLAPLNP